MNEKNLITNQNLPFTGKCKFCEPVDFWAKQLQQKASYINLLHMH